MDVAKKYVETVAFGAAFSLNILLDIQREARLNIFFMQFLYLSFTLLTHKSLRYLIFLMNGTVNATAMS